MTTIADEVLALLDHGPCTVRDILLTLPLDHPAIQSVHPQAYIRGVLHRLKRQGKVQEQLRKPTWQQSPKLWYRTEQPNPLQHAVDTGEWLGYPPEQQQEIEQMILAGELVDEEIYE